MEPLPEKLEQEIDALQGRWLSPLFSGEIVLDADRASRSIAWLYKLAGLFRPEIIFCESPLAAQIRLIELGKHERYSFPSVQLRILNCFYRHLDGSLDFTNASDLVLSAASRLKESLNIKVSDLFYTEVKNQVAFDICRKPHELADCYGISNLGDIARWKFLTDFCIIPKTLVRPALEFFSSGIYDAIFLKGVCILAGGPRFVKHDSRGRLHGETGPAVVFPDGQRLYRWHGVPVQQSWIERRDCITWQDVRNERNLERRRCLREILGLERYFMLQGGVKLVHEGVDGQGQVMKLYRSRKPDIQTRRRVLYLTVICPSTLRQYILLPPNQSSKNVWEAKASTFGTNRIQYRHGDVGLLNLGKEYARPELET
jgi:hypothetical protein